MANNDEVSDDLLVLRAKKEDLDAYKDMLPLAPLAGASGSSSRSQNSNKLLTSKDDVWYDES